MTCIAVQSNSTTQLSSINGNRLSSDDSDTKGMRRPCPSLPLIHSSLGLIYGGCHGPDEKTVFDELCQVVEEAIALYHKDGKPLPPSTSGRDIASRMQDVAYSAPLAGDSGTGLWSDP